MAWVPHLSYSTIGRGLRQLERWGFSKEITSLTPSSQFAIAPPVKLIKILDVIPSRPLAGQDDPIPLITHLVVYKPGGVAFQLHFIEFLHEVRISEQFPRDRGPKLLPGGDVRRIV